MDAETGDESARIKAIRAQYEAQLKQERAAADARAQAYASEFANSIDSMSAEEHIEWLRSLLPQAKSKFEFLLAHAKSESVSMTAIKVIFSALAEDAQPGDKLSELLKQLTA
jgi:hypothetical protein